MKKEKNTATVVYLSISFLLFIFAGKSLSEDVKGTESGMFAVDKKFGAKNVSAGEYLQFRRGALVAGFSSERVYIAGMGYILMEEFVGGNVVTPVSTGGGVDGKDGDGITRVRYFNVWRGITVEYEVDDEGKLRSTYIIEPFAEVEKIRLAYNLRAEVQKDGTLKFTHPDEGAYFTMTAPVAWQEIDGKKVEVEVNFMQYEDGTTIGFKVGSYDRAHVLIIDPTYQWHGFFGSSFVDESAGVAVDKNGNVYVAGNSLIPWGKPLNRHSGSWDMVILKLNSEGKLLWNTFLGSPTLDYAKAIAVDGDGNVYVTGYSVMGWGKPLNPHTGSGYFDIVVLKLNSEGKLLWHTFLGSPADDCGYGITVDGRGNVYVTGSSETNWGNPVNPHSGGTNDIIVLKLDTAGRLQWNTFHGCVRPKGDKRQRFALDENCDVYFYDYGGVDAGRGIALDEQGNIYVTGVSDSPWGNPVRPHAGDDDIVVLKLDSTGRLQWNTFYGTEAVDRGSGVAVDKDGNVYVVGGCDPEKFAPITTHFYGATHQQIAVLKYDTAGNLLWHSLHGGRCTDKSGIIVTDGNIYVAGTTWETWGKPENPHSGSCDVVLLKFDSSGTLKWNSFYGSDDPEECYGIAVDGRGNIYICGTTGSMFGWGKPVHPHRGLGDIVVFKIKE